MSTNHVCVVARSGHVLRGAPDLLVQASIADAPMSLTRLAALRPGHYLAIRYGAGEWPSEAARLPPMTRAEPHQSKDIYPPEVMTTELAFLLGAYASEGHTTRCNWTVVITNSVPGVLERCAGAWQSEFGLHARIQMPAERCSSVIVHSKALVLWMQRLGCGERARNKRIPRTILDGTRDHALAFLQGLALDAYVTTGAMAKWALCVDSPGLLDDVQVIMTRLGVVHGRVSKWNSVYLKSYGEVYTAGAETQKMLGLVPFMEPEKAVRAGLLIGRLFAQSTADVVPGISPMELSKLLPRGRSGRSGKGTSMSAFAYLRDPRTKHVSRRTLERLVPLVGDALPDWLHTVIEENWRFSPIVSCS